MDLTRDSGLIQPLLKVDLAKSRVIAGNQRALVKFGPEVSRVAVDDCAGRDLSAGPLGRPAATVVGMAVLREERMSRDMDSVAHWVAMGCARRNQHCVPILCN